MDAGESSGKCNSFTPDTRVLLANGRTKAIKDLKPGDKVKSTDPVLGGPGTQTVTATIKGHGTKHLVRLTLANGKSVTATDGHPIWLPKPHRWAKASELRSGDWLQTSAGTYIQVTAVRAWTQTATVNNLTVSSTHTYYVLAGATAVLVHNCNDNIISNADGFDNSAELSQASAGDVYSGAYNPGDGTFYARLSVDEKDPTRFPNAVLSNGGHGEVNFWHFQGSRETVGFNIFFEGDGLSVGWLSRSVNRRNFGDPMAPLGSRQEIMDAISRVTGMVVRSR
ncbi:Hint domain-containing protein [Streptomyces sp. NPDC051016]|uniref:Hint domain-containing protein n=1 Tax=Streptomyces sp. NPDC051016 TaxID=3365638 RepID=UPI0037AC7D9E